MRGSRETSKICCAVALAVFAMITSAGSAFAQSASSSEPTTFRWGDTTEPSSLNPIVGYLGTDFTMWAATYNIPIEFRTEDFGPDLSHSIVTSVDTSSDGMTFTYHMRPGMKWSDGQPFTANDVAWTYGFYKKYNVANYAADIQAIDTVIATDDTTFVITSTHPTSFYSGQAVFLYDYILPEHIFGKYENDYKDAKLFKNIPNVGSGPYVITDYQQGQSVTLEKNPNYWGNAIGLTPHYDRLVYVIYNNEDVEAAALRNGEIDMGYFTSANILRSLAGDPKLATRAATIPMYEDIGINTGSAYETDTTGGFTKHGDGAHALTDVAVRQAIRLAVDDQTIVDKVLLGNGSVADSPIQPTATTGNWDPPPDEALNFDISAANAKLDAAGYTMGADGVRIDPTNQQPLEFRYFTRNSDQNSLDTAPFVKDWLSQIGIKIDVSTMSSNKLETLIEAGTYDLFDWFWIPNPDPQYILGIYTCAQRIPRPGVYRNGETYFCDPRYDQLYEQQSREIDAAKRADVVHQMQSLLYQELPAVTLYYGTSLEAYRIDQVTGFTPQPADGGGVKGELLAAYGPFSFISIHPVRSTTGSHAKGGVVRRLDRGGSGIDRHRGRCLAAARASGS